MLLCNLMLLYKNLYKTCLLWSLHILPTFSKTFSPLSPAFCFGSNSKDSKFSGGIAKLVLFEIRFRNPFPKGGSGMNSKQSWNRARFRPEGKNFVECQNYFKALKNSPRMEESERFRIQKILQSKSKKIRGIFEPGLHSLTESR